MKITDKMRLDWLISSGFMKWLGIDGTLYGARQAIDAAIRAEKEGGRR